MAKRANPPPLTRALVQDNVPAKVMDGLWIGSIHAAFNQDSMQDRGITHVLNASGLPATFPRQFTYFTVDVRDKESTNILGAIGIVNFFIEAGVDKGGVLVHCAGGRSRSVAFVVAFIMSTQGCSYDHAYAQVRRVRPVASVNRGFEQQLRAYGATQCDLFAAHQMMLRVKSAMLYERRAQKLQRAGSTSSITSGPTTSDGARGGAAEDGTGGRGAGAGRVRGGLSEPGANNSAQGPQQLPPPTPPLPLHQTIANGSAGSSNTAVGMPPTIRSPRGRAPLPPSSSPVSSLHWQRKGGSAAAGKGAEGVGGAVTGAGAGATSVIATGGVSGGGGGDGAGGPSSGATGRDELQFLSKEPRPTRFRLCRPGSASIQVIPPLKHLERIYACRACEAFLFTGGHVFNLNTDLPSISAILGPTTPGSPAHEYYSDPEAEATSCVHHCSMTDTTPATVPASCSFSVSSVRPSTMGSLGSALPSHPAYGLLPGGGDRISPTPPPPPLPPPDQLIEETKYSSVSKTSWKRPGLSTLESGALISGGGGLSGGFKLERPPAHLGRWPHGPPEVGGGPPSTVGTEGLSTVSTSSTASAQGEFRLERPPAHLGRWPEVTPTPSDTGAGGAGRVGTETVANDYVQEGGPAEPLAIDTRRTAPRSTGLESIGSSIAAAASRGLRVPSPKSFVPPSCPLRPGGTRPGGGVGNRNKPAFGFESEDDCSAADPSEQADGSRYVAETRSRRLPDAMTTGTSSGGSGLAGWRNSSGLEFGNLMMQTRGSSRGRELDSASPDRMMTPCRSPGTPYGSVASASTCAPESPYASNRPLSAEKRQFLLKMQALEVSGSTMVSSAPSDLSVLTDLDTMFTSETLNARNGRWIYVDFLEWMGDIMASPTGRITCPSPGCGVELGAWSWETGAEAVRAPTGPPVIVMEKSTIKVTSYTLSEYDSRNSRRRDDTPRDSPTAAQSAARVKLSPPEPGTVESGGGGREEGGGTGGAEAEDNISRRLSGILESTLAGSAARQNQQREQEQQQQQPPPPSQQPRQQPPQQAQQQQQQQRRRRLQPQLAIEQKVQLHLHQQAQLQQQFQHQRQACRGSPPSPILEEGKLDGLSPHEKPPAMPQQEKQFSLHRGPPPPYPG